MLWDTCHPAPDNLTNEASPPDNEDIVLVSMKSEGEQVTTNAAATNSNTVAVAALVGRPSTHSSKRLQQVQGSLVEYMGYQTPALNPSPNFCPVDPGSQRG